MGYDHSTPRDLIFGPEEFGGFNVRHLFTEMMGMKLDSIISHVRADSSLGKAIVININYIQLILGLEKPILSSTQSIPYMDTKWILNIRDFLISINAQLDMTNIWKPTKARVNDQFIMQAAMECNISNPELIIFNNWRIFFKVSRLSDICNTEDNKIQQCYLKCPATRKINSMIQPMALSTKTQQEIFQCMEKNYYKMF
jgi:hypothetical protein